MPLVPGSTELARRSLLVEIVGPAGSGKSTIAAALADGLACRYLRSFRRDAGVAPSVHGAADVATEVLRVAPVRSGVRVARLMIRPIVARPLLRSRGARVVFDQGPAYGLVRLAELSARRPTGRLSAWTADEVARWHRALDIVVFLDAPDAVLGARIDGREKPHRLKGRPSDDRVRFLARERTILDRTADLLSPRTTIRVDTASTTVARAATDIIDAIRRSASAEVLVGPDVSQPNAVPCGRGTS